MTEEVEKFDSSGTRVTGIARSWAIWFDKRTLPCYASIKYTKYLRIASTVANRTGYNTFKGHVTRASRLCSKQPDFVLAVARILVQ